MVTVTVTVTCEHCGAEFDRDGVEGQGYNGPGDWIDVDGNSMCAGCQIDTLGETEAVERLDAWRSRCAVVTDGGQ